MKRLLCIVGSMDAGGAETFLMKIYRSLDKKNYQMDFCVTNPNKNFYEDEIIQLGGKMYRVPSKSKGMVKNFLAIKNIVQKNQYKYVLRVSQFSLSAFELLAAKCGGAKVLAFRASNANTEDGKLITILHYMFRPLSNLISNVKISPSTEAAIYVFGKRVVKAQKYYVLRNGLDVEKFKFSLKNREMLRKKLKIEDKFVIGHVGRFAKQKNHRFLLEVFKEYLKKHSNSVLLLIGTGNLEPEIKDYAKKLEISDSVIFYGITDKVNELYSAMDFFLFPSYYEGMPNTVIEAEASGLKCLISDTITKECQLTDRVKFKSLSSSAESWSQEITISTKREEAAQILYDKSYDIKSVVLDFTEIIFKNTK